MKKKILFLINFYFLIQDEGEVIVSPRLSDYESFITINNINTNPSNQELNKLSSLEALNKLTTLKS
jgi:hypothetical protein